MIIMLVAKENQSILDAKKDAESIKKAFDLYKSNRKNVHQNPFIVSITGYDVYAIPGELIAVESDSDNIVRLDIGEIVKYTEGELS